MKAVLISIQPYWVYLIIARKIGIDIPKVKSLELRKSFPQDKDWDRNVIIYCSKNMKSFNRIPLEHRDIMRKYLGKVIGEFVCDKIIKIKADGCLNTEFGYSGNRYNITLNMACLTEKDLYEYLGDPNIIEQSAHYSRMEFNGYGWHISELVIYDEPKELSEFWLYNEGLHKRFDNDEDFCCYDGTNEYGEALTDCGDACNNILNCYRCWEEWSGWCKHLKKPPQSWCYVEELI